MKRFILAIVLSLFSMSALALDKCFEGNWYDPTTDNGVGIDIEVLEPMNVTVAHYYTWHRSMNGYVFRDTYVLVGENDIEGAWAFNAQQSVWAGDHATTYNVGTGSVTQIDNNTIRFEYDFKYNFLRYENPNTTIPWCIGCWQDVEYKRLTQPHPCE